MSPRRPSLSVTGALHPVGVERIVGLFGVSPLDPATYVSISAALIAAAGLASYLPTRRATRLDLSLRDE